MTRFLLLVLVSVLAGGFSRGSGGTERSPQPKASPTPATPTPATTAARRVAGFVPEHEVSLTSRKLTVLYGGTLTLAPGSVPAVTPLDPLRGPASWPTPRTGLFSGKMSA